MMKYEASLIVGLIVSLVSNVASVDLLEGKGNFSTANRALWRYNMSAPDGAGVYSDTSLPVVFK